MSINRHKTITIKCLDGEFCNPLLSIGHRATFSEVAGGVAGGLQNNSLRIRLDGALGST